MRGWITPDAAPDETRVIKLTVPSGLGWDSCILGALSALFDPANWEQTSATALTPEEAAGTMASIMDDSLVAWEDC